MLSNTPDHRFQRWLTSAALYESDWRQENEENYDFYDGAQWTDEEESVLEARGQQATVLNIIRPTVDMVLALQSERRIDLQVVGREASDWPVADLLTELVKQVGDENDFGFYESRCFRDGVIGGRGWLQAGVGDNERILVQHIPWEEVYVDPYHRKPDATDARFIIRRVWMDRDQVKERYGDNIPEGEVDSVFNDDYHGQEEQAQTNAPDRALKNHYEAKSDRIAINETWYKDKENKVRYVVWSDRVFLEGSEDGENPSPYEGDFYPLVPYYSFRKHTGEPQGLVSYLKDMQRMLNKLNSKYIWNMSANRLMLEEGAVGNPDEAREEWNRPDGTVLLESGGLNKVRIEENLRESTYLANHMNFIMAMAQRTSGINDSMLGMGGVNERSATQQANRILQGSQMQTQMLENLFFTKKALTRVILRLIGETYTEQTVVRITQPNGDYLMFTLNEPATGDDGSPVILNKIEDILRYDVVLKEVPVFNTVRQYQAQVFSEVAKAGVFPPQLVGKALIELSDLPNKQKYLSELEQYYQAQAQAAQQAAAIGTP